MKNAWMLDVIEDLRRFADLNDMPRLHDELLRVSTTAKREILRHDGPAPLGMACDGMGQNLSRQLVEGQDA